MLRLMQKKDPESTTTPKPRVLVVDDNRSLVRVTEGVLRKEGFDVITAFDGLEGLQMAQELKPDVIVLDVLMPEMDGYQVCRSLQDDPNTSSIPVIILTSKGTSAEDIRSLEGGTPVDVVIDGEDTSLEEDEERVKHLGIGGSTTERRNAFQLGATSFLAKPVSAQVLVDQVKFLSSFSSFKTQS